MEIFAPNNNNNDQITLVDVSTPFGGHPQSSQLSSTRPDNNLVEGGLVSCLAPPGVRAKSLQSAKSKKSLKSIVDRLSKQYSPISADSQQFMTALSLKETSNSSRMFPTQAHSLYQVPVDEALDLSLKKSPILASEGNQEAFQRKTDAIGALDLSVSSSKVRPDGGNRSPDFVLDLTKPSPCENDAKDHNWSVKSQNHFQNVSSPLKGPVKDEQDDFQANHIRVLQFLANHTIQQKVRGADVDIELLTCRYCKYASTEKSCMMAHLTTTHVSKKHSGSSRFHHHPHQTQYHQMEGNMELHQQQSHANGTGSRPTSRKQKSDAPCLVMLKNDQDSHSLQVIQVMDHNNQIQQTFLPASLVELAAQTSLPVPKVVQIPRYEHSPKKSSRVSRNTSPQRRRIKQFYDHQRHSSRNHMSTSKEGIQFVPYQVGSILEERLTLNQVNAASNMPSTSGPGDPKVPKSSNIENISESLEEQQRLDHLCTRLAGRMGVRNQRGRVQHRHHNQSVVHGHRPAARSRRRKSSGGKRQSLIAQTGNFSCEYCSKTFKRPLSLYGHLKQHSPLLKKHRKGLFQCRTCPLTFSSFADLLQHMRTKHPQNQVTTEDKQGSSLTSQGVPAQIVPSFPTNDQIVQSSSMVPVEKKSGRSRKTKPYSLRDQARRDYLLDHDPMMDQRVIPSLQETSTSSLETKTEKKMSSQSEIIVHTRKKVRCKTVSRDVKALLRLSEKKKNSKIRCKVSSNYALGMSWKRVLRRFKEKSNKQHLRKVLRFLLRRPKHVQCKVCDATVKTFLKALLHLERRHMRVSRKEKCPAQESKQKGTVTSKSPKKVEMSVLSKPESSADNSLYVKMSGGGEHYQCNLCLQLFKGRDALIEHLEMHKKIYEEGMRSFSNKSAEGSAKKEKADIGGMIDTTEANHESLLEGLQAHETSKHHSSPFGDVHIQPSKADEVKNMHKTEKQESQISPADSEVLIIPQKVKLGSPSKGQRLKKHLFGSFAQDGSNAKKFLCKICMFSSFTLDEMKRHMRKHCKIILNCEQCSYQTIERRFMIRHIQTVHEQRRPYTCELCVYSTAYKHHLRRHYKSHSVDLLSCSLCSFCTLQESKFREHKREHDLSPNIVMCDDCGLTFANDKLLKEHQTETHNKQPSKEKEASSQPKDPSGFAANWWENISTATLDKEAIYEQHRCESCGFFDEDNDALMNHMTDKHLDSFQEEQQDIESPQDQNQMTMDLSVQCPQCGFITSKDQLKSHLETHNSDETYACEHCPYETKSLEALQRHKSKHIKHKVSLTCVQCDKVQSDILTLRDHTRVHLIGVDNNNMFRCSLCTFTTNSSEDGKFHLDQHNYVMEFKCQVCMYSSPTLSGLTSHRRLHRKLKATTHTMKKSSPTKSQVPEQSTPVQD